MQRRRILTTIPLLAAGCITTRDRGQPGDTRRPRGTPVLDEDDVERRRTASETATPLPNYPEPDDIRAAIRNRIKEYRLEVAASTISSNGDIPARLRDIASRHVDAMMQREVVGKEIEGSSLVTTLEGFEPSCQTMHEGSMLSGAQLSLVDALELESGQTPRGIANTLLERWRNDRRQRRVVGAEGVRWLGQELAIQDGVLYVVVIMC